MQREQKQTNQSIILGSLFLAGSIGKGGEVLKEPSLVVDHSILLAHILGHHQSLAGPGYLGLDNHRPVCLFSLGEGKDLKK